MWKSGSATHAARVRAYGRVRLLKLGHQSSIGQLNKAENKIIQFGNEIITIQQIAGSTVIVTALLTFPLRGR